MGPFGFKAINWSGRLDYVPLSNPSEMQQYFDARARLVRKYVYVFIYICMYACLYVCMYVYA